MTDKPVDKDPQNFVADADLSIKQVVEAKSNSSVSGVVQANSINNSTINIHVDNRVHKDEQPSKPSQNKKRDNLPHRNRFFTGRVDVLNQLAELIKSNKEVTIKQAISGMGGIGKTQTALEFCHQHINHYQTILWITAENEVSFNSSYYGLVNLLNLVSGNGATNDAASNTAPNDGASNEALKVDEVISLVKSWLANNPNWLMVLDNLEDPKLINNYLPSNHQGHVLITTRSQSLKGQAAIVQLKKMSPETGTLFLLKRASLIPIDANNLEQFKADNGFDDKLIDKLIGDAQKIVQAMDGLPLALEQAGAYIQESECSLADYLKAYQDTRNTASVLDNDGEDTNDHKSVFATFKLNFDVVKAKNLAAAKLLEVCSFLDSELIPEEIFTSAGSFLGDELAKLQDNNYEFNNCLKLLLGYSLIERDTNNKSLSIHRLVQTVLRELITENNKKFLLDSLAKSLCSLSNDDAQDPKHWPTYKRLLPSIINILKLTKDLNITALETILLFHLFGLYCFTQVAFSQALEFYKQTLFLLKLHFGNNHHALATTLNNIGLVYDSQGSYSQALDFYNQALDIYICDFDTNQANIATVFHNIGIIYESLDEHNEALFYLSNSLSISKNLYGNNSIACANTLGSIAIIYQKKGNYTESLIFHQEALSIFKHHLDPNHLNIAKSFDNIASIYKAQGNYSQALSFYNQAINIYKHLFGSNHPDLAGTFNNVGEVYRQQGNYPAALDCYNQSLNIYKHLFPNNHPDLAITLANIAVLYQTTNKQLEAANYYQQALEIVDKFLPQNHPHIKHLLTQYSQLLLKLNTHRSRI